MITEIDLDVSPDKLRLRALNFCQRRHVPLVLKAVKHLLGLFRLQRKLLGPERQNTHSSLLRRTLGRSSIRKNPLTCTK